MVNNMSAETAHAGKVAGRFKSGANIAQAIHAAEDLGYSRGDIQVISRGNMDRHNPADAAPAERVRGNYPMQGPWFGAMLGAVLSGALGIVTGLFLPPMMGLAVRPLLLALLLGGLLALIGFYLGSLLGVGLPEGREKEFQKAVEEGEVLLSLNPRTEADAAKIKREWKQLGAEEVAG